MGVVSCASLHSMHHCHGIHASHVAAWPGEPWRGMLYSMPNGGCTRRSTVSYCPEEGWIARAPLPAARVGHAMVALGGRLYRCREHVPSWTQAAGACRDEARGS